MIGLPECRHERRKRCGYTKAGTQRFKCLGCGKRFTASTATLAGMRLGTDKAAQVISMLCEGLSVRAVSRLADVDKNTILELLLLVGERCRFYMENAIVGVDVQELSVDELWSFCGMKERTRKILSRPVGSCGDRYCFIGVARESRLVLAFHSGPRDADNGLAFVRKLSHACKGRSQISSDGWRPYKWLIPNLFPRCDYGQIIKVFGPAPDTVRYSPGKIISTKRRRIAGNPDESRINTSHSERFNLSVRMCQRRFTRLTNAFSRSHAHHDAALALFFMHYNYVANHGTLGTTPAVAAALAQEPWTVGEMIERTANYVKPEPKPPTWGEFLDTIPDEE